MSYDDEIGKYLELSRRRFLKRVGTLAAATGTSGLAIRPRHARAADNVIRVMGITTVALPDWSQFEADTGLRMEFTPIDADMGPFYHEVKANDAGDRYDIFAKEIGVHRSLSGEGYILPIDTSRMPLWAGAAKEVKESPLLAGTGGTQWGVPLVLNADSFGYFPTVLNEPRPPEPVSYDLCFDNQKTLGHVGLDDSYFTVIVAANFMKWRGLAEIGDPAEMTPKECKVVADYLIERKKAGQFRVFSATYEEQVALFVNREVRAQMCWEPGIKDARRQGADVEYATTHEGYAKWMIAGFIPAQVKERGNIENVYEALNWFLSGAYAAEVAVLRGYGTSRPDLGLEYAREHNWSEERIGMIEENIHKIKVKFAHPSWWDPGDAIHLDAYEREMDRFRNA